MDRCWTVPVTMAASAFLICMPWTWFGLLLVLFVEKFDVTRETASWPKSVAIMLSHLSGLVVYALQRRIKTFYIVLHSTILTSAAFITAAFAPNMFWMTITVGVIHENRRCADQTDKAAQPESSPLKDVLALFTTPSFYVLLGAILVGDYTGVEFLSTIVDYGVDKGFELGSAQHLVTFSSAGQLVGRIIVPVLADCVPSTRRPLYAFSFAAFGVCMMTMPQVNLILPALVLATLAGVVQGYIMCIRYVLLAEYLGVERTAASSGIVGVAMVPLSLVSPVIIGHFRDATGSYDSYYQMLGIISLVAAVLFATHDFCHKKCTRDAQSQ
ncbi:monocarboxylate transporter 12-like isoform X2 [Dermacentor albipictus]|uniref:monocarboxylate transporter 12-like isoform X2 n=1 Tax=Dermacentor albipictus TaxID=60249 RepID=UPI0038FD069F